MATTIVTPGHRIGTASEFSSGPGTFNKRGYIYASLVGELITSSAAAPSTKPVASVQSIKAAPTTSSAAATTTSAARVPAASDIILGKVTRVTSQSVNIDITHLDGQNISKASFKGLLRKQDAGAFSRPVNTVASAAMNEIHLIEMYRPGDVVRATVLSLGDSKANFLSCVGDEYGVVEAYSEASREVAAVSKNNGVLVKMIPVSWVEMACPVTGVRESRKCAKPVSK